MTVSKIVQGISHELKIVAAMAKEPATISIKAGDALIREKQKGKFMYVVQKGAVNIMYKDIQLERVSAGGIVGEMALIDQAERSADVIAHKDSVLIPIGRSRFLHLVRMEPEFALQVIDTMIKRVRQMNIRLDMSTQT